MKEKNKSKDIDIVKKVDNAKKANDIVKNIDNLKIIGVEKRFCLSQASGTKEYIDLFLMSNGVITENNNGTDDKPTDNKKEG